MRKPENGCRVMFRLMKADKDILIKTAKSHNIPVADYIRRAINCYMKLVPSKDRADEGEMAVSILKMLCSLEEVK